MKTCPLQKVSGVGVTVSALTSVMLILGCWHQGQQLTVNIVHNTSSPCLVYCTALEVNWTKQSWLKAFSGPTGKLEEVTYRAMHVLHSS